MRVAEVSRRDPARRPRFSHRAIVEEVSSKGAPRFVVQEHSARRLHWDLRLEHDGAAVSWAIPNGIPQDPSENRKAVHVEDHSAVATRCSRPVGRRTG